MSNPMKEEKLRATLNNINSEIEREIASLYEELFAESQKYNANTIDNFLRNKEPEKINGYINHKIDEIKEDYIKALQQINCLDGKNYSNSQAILMWRSVAGKIEIPSLNPLEKADVIKTVNEVKKQQGTDVTNKDKIIALSLAGGVLGLAWTAIPTFLGWTSLFVAGGTAIHQGVTDNLMPFERIWRRGTSMPGNSAKPMIDRKALGEVLNTQRKITTGVLKKWSQSIFELVVREEPLL